MAKSSNYQLQYPKLAALGHQFRETAFTYGRLIISERAIDPQHRTIKPINIGGVAGGDKYIKNGILFKFAMDPIVATKNGKPVYLYGGLFYFFVCFVNSHFFSFIRFDTFRRTCNQISSSVMIRGEKVLFVG